MQWSELSREKMKCVGREKRAEEPEDARQSCLVEISHFQ